MTFTRKSGILLHPTSLSGSPGIGTLGKSAYRFADWLHRSNQKLWQILPLGPTGYGDSPYASFSTFAGNPLLVDFELLVERGWASADDTVPPDYIRSDGPVDFGSVVWWKLPALSKCALYFLSHANDADRDVFASFKNDNEAWLDTYAVFMSVKNFFDEKAKTQDGNPGGKNVMWNNSWPKELASCEPKAVEQWKVEHAEEIEIIKAIQFFFAVQWGDLKRYANSLGIDIIGDIPIFVAPDSADVWANQKLFQLDENGIPTRVAGVPPDYFSATGQLWGNPLYDWDAMKKNGYAWWISRIRRMLSLVDCIRIDHFRGFESYWSVPYGEETAVKGMWVKCPGADFFAAVKASLGDIPIIAEDLGVITDEVRALRDACGFPGMKVLEFAFDPEEAGRGGMTNAFLPHEYENTRCVVYTGTHDNDTLQGWLLRERDDVVRCVAEYLCGKPLSDKDARTMVTSGELCGKLIREAFASIASYAVIPLQDVLGLDNGARMNTPSTTGGNWMWRMDENALSDKAAASLAFLSKFYGRNGE